MTRISVCMTTYNGEKYVERQVQSILSQIGENDELIVCDDRSSDSTISIVSSFKDRRIKIVVNETNLGFSANFSNCIGMAEGEYIFLSDHDDVWLPDKIDKYLKIFDTSDNILCIMSNMEIIDENGDVTNARFLRLETGLGNRFYRLAKNFVKSTYYGCSMAFRKDMKSKILPLPFHFDTWIALVSDIYGRCYHLDEVTMQYRRHSNNFSKLKTSPARVILKWRMNLLLNLLSLTFGVRKNLLDNKLLSLLKV